MTLAFTILGLLFILAGIGCGVRAYRNTLAEHDPNPLWPWASQQVARVRGVVVRITRWIRPRQSNVVYAKAGGAFGGLTAHATGYRAGLQISPDLSLEEQIRLLIGRIADAEEATRRESERHRKELQDIRAEIGAHTERLTRADEDIKQPALALSLGTARLQIAGLILVGVGTVFMAVPALLGP